MKKLLSVLLLCALFLFSAVGLSACGMIKNENYVHEEPTADEYFTFTLLENDTYEIAAKDVNDLPAEVILPSTHDGKAVTRIDYEAFYCCIGLMKITIPASVNDIEEDAFSGCWKLIEIYNKSSVNIIAGPDEDEGGIGFYTKNVYTPTSGASKLSTDKNGYVIYTDVEDKILVGYLGDDTELTLPSGITEIYQYAFAESGLTDINIPDSVTVIGDNAFYKCSGLTDITITDSVKGLGESAFEECDNLTSVTFGANSALTIIGSSAFEECDNLTTITIPDSVTRIESYAFYNSGLTSVNFGKNSKLQRIGGYAFSYCSGLTDIDIPDSVTEIGYEAFSYCGNLTAVNFGENSKFTTFSWDVFRSCDSLTTITLPESLTSINFRAFLMWTGLTAITIPDTVTSIEGLALANCRNLTDIVIGSGVTSIAEKAFRECNALTAVYYKGTAEEWDEILISSNNSPLIDATKYYYSENYPENFVADTYWHYVDGEIVIWAETPIDSDYTPWII